MFLKMRQYRFLAFFIVLLFVGFGGAEQITIYNVPPISDIKRLPDVVPEDGIVTNSIYFVATPGEYEPASIVIRTSSNKIENITFEKNDFVCGKNIIPASNLDIKIVKCWYQANTAWENMTSPFDKKVLVPELLLNDNSLVKVDYQTKTNYVRIKADGKEKYIDCTTPGRMPHQRKGLDYPKNSEFPVSDSKILCPFNIPASKSQQLWFTIHVPDNAKSGIYTSKIIIKSGKTVLAELDVKLRVLPFKLAQLVTYYDSGQKFTSSIYYKGILCTQDNMELAGLRGWWKTPRQFCAELANMKAHGIDNPLILQPQVDSSLDNFAKVLQLRKQADMDNTRIYLLGKERNWGLGTKASPARIKKALEEISKYVDVAKKCGAKEVYVYGIDEATGKAMADQLDIWEQFHKAGLKIFVAGFMHKKPTPFELAGDVLDLLVNNNRPTRKVADLWHGNGKKVWCYSYPQGGVENPLAYRRNYGLVLWKARFDGACTYAYHHGYGHVWNDFDGLYRDHNLTYPTVNGVIDTIAWEGYREAIDDIKYACTLKKAIAEAKRGGTVKQKSLAENAEKWLENIDEDTRNLDTIRMKMIDAILKLKKGRPE